MNNIVNEPVLKGDLEKITALTVFLKAALESYVQEEAEHGGLDAVDILMAAHNFHKHTVNAIAIRMDSIIPKEHTLKQADMAFRRAIRELRLPDKV